MKLENFLGAMEIISGFHSVSVVVNKVKEGGSLGNMLQGSPTISLKNANTGCLNALGSAGFNLSLISSPDGVTLEVNDTFK